jgi:hypothetical protein
VSLERLPKPIHLITTLTKSELRFSVGMVDSEDKSAAVSMNLFDSELKKLWSWITRTREVW